MTDSTTPHANPDNAFWHMGEKIEPYGKAWLFSFGAYGDVKVVVWEKRLEDALEAAAEWLQETAPGCFVEPDYADAALELDLKQGENDEDDEKIREHAETDLTYTESGWLPSWEWHVTEIEDPLELYILLHQALNILERLG